MESQLSITRLSCDRLIDKSNDQNIVYKISLEGLVGPTANRLEREITIGENKRKSIITRFKKLYRPSGKGSRKQNTARGVSGQPAGQRKYIEALGKTIFKTFFSDSIIRDHIESIPTEYLQISTNDPEMPWELAFPESLEGLLGKKFATSNRIVINQQWLEQLKNGIKGREKKPSLTTDNQKVRILFIVNPEPTLKLRNKYGLQKVDKGFDKPFNDEVENIQHELVRGSFIDKESITFLSGEEASSNSLFYHLQKFHYDILHFAGHSVFDPADSSKSGLILSDCLLTPKILQDKLEGNCPSIIFLNSCVSALSASIVTHANESPASLLEGFCVAGAKAIIGTLWEPDSKEAKEFSICFYEYLLRDQTIGKALQKTKIRFADMSDENHSWACYVLYGDPGCKLPKVFKVKKPFKVLDRYDENDAGIYFGREENTNTFLQKIKQCPILTVTGISGVGKSSFLRAAIIPKLRELDYMITILDVGNSDPIPSILQDLNNQLIEGELKENTQNVKCLRDYLSLQKDKITKPLVIIFDQFERFLIDLENKEDRDRVMRDILDCVKYHQNDQIHFVFTLRIDYWADLEGYLKGEYWSKRESETLNFFNEKEAREIISKPLDMFGVTLDDKLFEKIIEDLKKTPEVSGHGNHNLIYPPYLQILCNKLYEKALEKGKASDGSLNLTLNDYVSEDSVALIETHLQDAISRLGKRGKLGEIILQKLSSAEGFVISSEDVGQENTFKEQLKSEGFSISDIDYVLNGLIEDRLVLWNANKYQLVHDCIAMIIVHSMGEGERRVKEINGRIDRSITIWKSAEKSNRKLFNAGMLNEAEEYIKTINLTDKDTVEFLVKSAVWNDDLKFLKNMLEIDKGLDGGSVFNWIHEFTESKDVVLKHNAIKALGLIEGSESVDYLIKTIIETEDKKFIEIGIDSLVVNQRIEALKKLLNEAKKIKDENKKFIILAFLSEDHRGGLAPEGENSYVNLMQKMGLSFFERFISLRKEIWNLRKGRVYLNKGVLLYYAGYGALYGLYVAFLAAAWPVVTNSSIPYNYYLIKGQIFADIRSYSEGLMTAVFGGILSFPIIRAFDVFAKGKPGWKRCLYGYMGGVVIAVGMSLYFVIAMTAQFYGPQKESFYVSMGAGLALTVIGFFAIASMMSGLIYSLNYDGRRNIYSSINCIISLLVGFGLCWLVFKGLHGNLILEGLSFVDLPGDKKVKLLTYSNINIFSEILRFFTWGLGMSIVYYWFYNKEVLKKIEEKKSD